MNENAYQLRYGEYQWKGGVEELGYGWLIGREGGRKARKGRPTDGGGLREGRREGGVTGTQLLPLL